MLIAISTIVASTFEIGFVPQFFGPQLMWLAQYFFETQDRFWLVVVALLFLALAFSPLPAIPSRAVSHLQRKPYAAVTILALCVLVAGVVGTHIVFHDFHLTRDELLAEFDATIFRSGKFQAPIDATWLPFASALQPQFMLPVFKDVGFASNYLPVNAAFRALVGLIAPSTWTSPLLAAAGTLATFGVARRLWPTRLDAAFISALLVATSTQVLILSMTSYAMSAHLALNMIWLWFFLRDDKIGLGGALATGFLASGLHQLIFHPLFVAPFIVRLWRSGKRSQAGAYVAGYAAICMFWIAYWKLTLTWQGASPQLTDNTGPLYFLARVLAFAEYFQWSYAELMLDNALRFVAWQSPALLPLALLAYPAMRRCSGIAAELIAGLLLTFLAMFLLVPYQGHGWGYRYVHGLIGNLALLAGYGWIALSNRINDDEIGASRTMFAICSAVALIVLLPIRAMQAHDFVLPYINASKAIEQTPADVVIVDESRLNYAADLVRNDPFLRNRPLVLDVTYLPESHIASLCSRYRVALFDYDQALALGIAPNERLTVDKDAKRARLRQVMSQVACKTEPVVRTK